MRIVKHISRILIGLTFMFSGFVKGIDPLGFAYKITDYLEVMGLEWLGWAALPLSILASLAEFTIGVTLFFNAFTRIFAWFALIFMIFFTGLTFWIALSNPVTDCGCFGDALVITNWQTFYKNIILITLAIIVFVYRKKMESLFNGKLAVFLAVITVTAYLLVVYYSYQHLPVLNFRPFKNGTNIPEAMSYPADAQKPVFQNYLYYKNRKTGEIKEFTEQNFPWQDTVNWAFSEMKTKKIKDGYVPKIHDFKMEDSNGVNRLDEFMADENYLFLLIAYDLNKTSLKHQRQIEQLAGWAQKKNMKFIGLTGNSLDVAKQFSEKNNIGYEFFNCDATALKTAIRSNPGLLLLKKGTIINQWHHNDIPSPEYIEKQYLK